MKSLFQNARQTHTAMIQKVKDAFQHRDDMRIRMEEAFTTKEAVSTVTHRTDLSSSVYFYFFYLNPCSSTSRSGSKKNDGFVVFIKPIKKNKNTNKAVLVFAKS